LKFPATFKFWEETDYIFQVYTNKNAGAKTSAIIKRKIRFSHNQVDFFTFDLVPYLHNQMVIFSSKENMNIKIRL
jgi:hypothetical protein